MVQYEINISGRVQGVGFRYYVYKRAIELNLKGWVKNTYSGVKIMVKGEITDIDTFTDYLRIGPPLARITGVNRVKMPQLEEFEGFTIRY
jgi:acylphosphatase